MDIDTTGLVFPMILGPDRGLAVDDVEGTVRSMLMQILLTEPGERVNRPTFGVGVQDVVFEPNGPQIANQLRIGIEENIEEYLGSNVRLHDVTVEQTDATLLVRISFQIIGTIEGPLDVEVSVPLLGLVS